MYECDVKVGIYVKLQDTNTLAFMPLTWRSVEYVHKSGEENKMRKKIKNEKN